MTVWKSLEEKPKYGIAIHNFNPRACGVVGLRGCEPLSLHVGELLEVAWECPGWYLGRRIAGRRPAARGLFPSEYVRLRECSVDRTGSLEIVNIVQPQIVQEITNTLKAWVQHWKYLYKTCGEKFNFIEVSMRTLLELRSAFLSGTLPLDELKRKQRAAIYTIDRGNRELGMDLTVRCAKTNRQIDPRDVSTCQLYALHVDTAENIKQRALEADSSLQQSSASCSNFSFFASVRNFVCKMSSDAELLMSLYDGCTHKHFSESYVVRWSRDGLASDIDQLHNLRVLFTDLGTSDTKREKVYLVCYVIRVGSMEPQSFDNSSVSDFRPRAEGSCHRVRRPPYTRNPHTMRRSSVAAALVSGRSVSQFSGSSVGSVNDGGDMRRPLGVAAMDVTSILSRQLDVDDDKHHCVTFFPCEKDNLDTLLRRIIANKELKGDSKTGQGLWISVKLLLGDIKQIREEVPHLVVGNVSIARKMGFPEVILPGDARNDLYLCLQGGCFTRGGGKSTDRNIQVTVRVCNDKGDTIPGVISVGGGVQPIDEYKSVIYYHEDKPRWYEIFKICVPIEEFKQAHVVFLFKHRSSNEAKDKVEKPFALSYTPLMQPNGTTLNDIQHNLCVYKVDSKKWPSSGPEAATCYMRLPSQRAPSSGEKDKLQKGFLSLSPKDSFSIETNVCSTKLTQNVELLGVLNWCDHVSDNSLRESLISLKSVPGGEIVKFLQDILDALFSILTQADQERGIDAMESMGSYDMLVFECLLSLISLVSDRKYHHFQPVLDLYIKESFCSTLAYKKLCHILSQLVIRADNGDNEVLLKSMKCLEYLLRFVVRSRQLHAELSQLADQQEFQDIFQDLLENLVSMMRSDSKSALTSQGACIKYLPSSVAHIVQVFPETNLTQMIGEILHVLPLERLTKQRLIAIHDLIQGPLFLKSECRCILLPYITSNLKTLIETNDETSVCGVEIRSKNRSVDKIARVLGASRHKLQEHRGYSEQLELCVKILDEILGLLYRTDVGTTDEEFNHIIQCLLKTILKATEQMDRENPLMCRLVSVLLDMLRQMTPARYAVFTSSFPQRELLEFLMEVQLSLRELVTRPVFPSYWADLVNLQNSVVLNTQKLFASTLVEHFLCPFEVQGWSNWFHLSAAFVGQPSLQLERRAADQRRRLTAQHGDMRRELAKEIHTMWFHLGEYKMQFIPNLVGPFLEMSLIPETELRRVTIPLFYDMMHCEFNSPRHLGDDQVKGNFNDFENEMINKLDILVEAGHGDLKWSEMFSQMVGQQCSEDDDLRESGEHFVRVVSQLLGTLLQYRNLHDHSSMDYRMQATTTLLAFYSNIKRPEMYIRYVNKLCELHLECDNWTEAGLSLMLHASRLQWAATPLSALLRSHRHSQCITHRDLKEALYYEIINYFNKGKMWELAVSTCKELALQYEEEVYDFCHLAQLHELMSGFYNSIMNEPRVHPHYFRVGYYGRGFPEFLQNKVFVYRGKAGEKLQDFSSRILHGLPNADLMTTLTAPTDEIKDSDHKYVQINAVEPLVSETIRRMSGKHISNKIMEYHLHNNISKFRYSRPFYRQDESMSNGEEGSPNEFGNLWFERTELEIREKLPDILLWCAVTNCVTYEMSPLQVAIETMKNANKNLRTLVIEHRSDHTLNLGPLTLKLNGMVDPAVMGGIMNYEKAFFSEEYARAHPEHRTLILSLKEHIASQIPLLEFGIEVHRARLPTELIPLHKRIVDCFEQMKAQVHEKYGKRSCDLEKEISLVTMRRQVSGISATRGSFGGVDHRWSEISTQTNHSVESGISMGRSQINSGKGFNFAKQLNRRGSLGSGLSEVRLGGARSQLLGSSPARKKDKERRRARKSEANITTNSIHTSHSGSMWYTGPAPSSLLNGCSRPEPPAPTSSAYPAAIIELRQELTPSRPLRSEVEKERRLSQRPHSIQSGSNSNRNSAGTTDSNMSIEDDPPPLPQKTVRPEQHSFTVTATQEESPVQESYYQAVNFSVVSPSRSAVTSPVMRRTNYDTVIAPRGSFLYSSLHNTSVSPKVPIRKERAPTPPPKKRVQTLQN